VRIDSRHLRGELFPQIACAFINKRSGAKLGSAFLNVLNDLEDVHVNIHNLDEEDPDELIGKYMESWVTNASLASLQHSNSSGDHKGKGKAVQAYLPSVPVIMACGGDGTFSWMASTALKHAHRVMSSHENKSEEEANEKKQTALQQVEPPSPSFPPKVSYCVIPFPLGTGNDMSGVLGWGRSLSANPVATKRIIDSVELSSTGPKCDVWGVKYQNFHSMSRFNTMCNYFSIGADAKASRLFEQHRTSRPKLYRSQSFNKASYAAFGGFLALKGSSSLGKRIKCLLVDGKEIAVPPNAKALVVLNIPSYADGTKPWNVGKNHPKFKEAAIDDGMVEIFCLKSILSIALLKILRGVFSGGVKRLAQVNTKRLDSIR
jgi:diacylglycerol kinase family enzyme